jgi:hypothetical protein
MIFKTELVEKPETLLVRPYNTLKGKAGDVCVAVDLPTVYSSAPPRVGFLLQWGMLQAVALNE